MRLCIALILLALTTPVYAQTMGTTSGASSMVDVNSPATTTTHLITAPTVAAPGLTAAGVETCLGSTAGGLSLMGGGFTFGSTKVDEGCTIRLLARQLYAFGLQKAAMALMCEDAHVVLAMNEVGSPCPAAPIAVSAPLSLEPPDRSVTAAVQTSQTPVRTAAVAGGFILDLKPVSAEAPVQVSTMAAPPSQQEQAWFDRASAIN